MKFNRLYIGALLAGTIGFSSCSDSFLDTTQTDIETSDQIDDVIGSSPEQLIAFMRGINNYMIEFGAAGSTSHDDFGFMSMLHCSDMNADDVVLVNNGSGWFMYDHDLSNNIETYRRTRINWITPYTVIGRCNSLIKILDTESEDEQVMAYLGQSYALRALSLYYVINFYQHVYNAWDGPNGSLPGVPIILTDAEGGPKMGRNTVKEVLMQIQSDYESSLEYFERAGKWTRSGEDAKAFIDKYVANGLAARFYLMTQQWEKAGTAADNALQQPGLSLMSAADYAAGFSDISNKEWMWGMPITAQNTTVYASFFSHISNLSPGYAGIGAYRAISNWLYEKMDEDDQRKDVFEPKTIIKDGEVVANPDSLFNTKFGYVSNFENDLPYMRAAEMYLIKAEAYARRGDQATAGSILNELLKNRYSSDPGITTASIDDILIQRRIELWGEGFGLFDCKRTNRPINRGYEGSNFQSAYQYNAAIQNNAFNLQIPLPEITENPSISPTEQNPYPPILEPWSVDNPAFNNEDGTVTK